LRQNYHFVGVKVLTNHNFGPSLLPEMIVAPFPKCSPLRFFNKIAESKELLWFFEGLPGTTIIFSRLFLLSEEISRGQREIPRKICFQANVELQAHC
jgi:hypothetical protein